MTNKESFALLEIDPTDDETAIKKAYARKIRKIHPEENPDEWKKIRDAYETLLNSTKWKKKTGREEDEYSFEDKFNSEPKFYDAYAKEKEPADALSAEVNRIVDASPESRADEKALKTALTLLKQVPSICESYCGEYAPDNGNWARLRGSKYYLEAMKDKGFVEQYMSVLKDCVFPSYTIDSMFRDIETAEQASTGSDIDYSSFKRLLERKREEVTRLEKKDKLKNGLRNNATLKRMFNAKYDLKDFVKAGAEYEIDFSSGSSVDENNRAYICTLVLDNEPYSVILYQDKITKKCSVKRLFHPEYETPELCAEASKEIWDFHEKHLAGDRFKSNRRGIVYFVIFLFVIAALIATGILASSDIVRKLIVPVSLVGVVTYPVFYRDPFLKK